VRRFFGVLLRKVLVDCCLDDDQPPDQRCAHLGELLDGEQRRADPAPSARRGRGDAGVLCFELCERSLERGDLSSQDMPALRL
jgi:hypothetical protein